MVKAPFELITLEVPAKTTGQASGVRWFIAPLRLWKRRVYGENGKIVTKVSFGIDRSEPQYVGVMNSFPNSWRKA